MLGDGLESYKMKSQTSECAKIEQFAATVGGTTTYQICIQDFESKDYTLECQGVSVIITQQQFEDGTWQEVVRKALQGHESTLTDASRASHPIS
jgi:hypothetical protein